jgi:hypothetical protein
VSTNRTQKIGTVQRRIRAIWRILSADTYPVKKTMFGVDKENQYRRQVLVLLQKAISRSEYKKVLMGVLDFAY